MILVPAGEFMMGSMRSDYEKPVHRVYLDAFYMDKYEVTFDQYDRFCEATERSKPSDEGWGRGNRPVINVSWGDSKAYCEWVGKRLPTEAEWERACRAGSAGEYCYRDGDELYSLADYAWYKANSGMKAHPVGQNRANAFGLYDMHGNVNEWCSDWYRKAYLSSSPMKNPTGPSSGTSRVIRGGSWGDHDIALRSAQRIDNDPDYSNNSIGCRCARTP
jgi:formylglycine-generating enzyme required for sulfatase activity